MMMARAQNRGWRWALIFALTVAAGVAAEPADAATQPASPSSASAPQPGPAKAANPVTPKPRPRLSTQVSSQISLTMPAWTPLPDRLSALPALPLLAAPANQTPSPANQTTTLPTEPGEVRMEPFEVKDFRLPRTEPLQWLTQKAQTVELVKQYITPFDRYFLNRFTLPLFGISKEARARMMYEEDKRLQDMQWINDQVEQTKLLDPDTAKELLKIRNNIFVRPGQQY